MQRAPWASNCPNHLGLRAGQDMAFGAAFLLFDNIWNTNYPDWLPFNGAGTRNSPLA